MKVPYQMKRSALQFRKIDKRSEIFESFDRQAYNIERIPHTYFGSQEYAFVCQVHSILNEVDNGFIHNVVNRWKQLIELDMRFEPIDFVPFFPKLGFIKRFNLPRVERDMLKMFQSHVSKYEWLPDRLSVQASDVFLQDKRVIRWYAKPKPWNTNGLDPRKFLSALDKMARLVNFNVGAKLKSVDEYIESMNKHSSACYPSYNLKSNLESQLVMREFVDQVMNGESMNEILSLIFSQPITTYHRFSPKVKSQIRAVETKIRLVFGYPFGVLALQDMIHGDSIQKVVETSPFTVGKTRSEISELVRKLKYSASQQGKNILSCDVQGMDYRLSGLSVFLSHALMIEMNSLSSAYHSEQSRNIELALALYEMRSPVLGSWDSTVITCGGTKSGTRFNTFANSISLMLATVYHHLSDDTSDSLSMPANDAILIQGDDEDVEVDALDTLDRWRHTFSLFHMHLHPEKSKISQPFGDIDFLGMTWDIVNAPKRGSDWITSKLIYPERFLDLPFKDRFICRATSILLQIVNGKQLYLRMISSFYPELVRRFNNGDKVSVPLVNKSTSEPVRTITLPFDKILMIGWRLF